MADKLDMKSMNITQENIRKIQALFPNVVTEVMVDGKVQLAVDFDALREELSTVIVEGKQERYQFTWPEKSKAKLLAAKQITSTLRPCVEESVNFDTTQNLYIEGDNLDVLKLLQETYLGKVKMIYIDPPYNTGNDFVYEDDFAQTADEFSAISGDYDDMGNRMVKNVESNGRFHTDWLNMIYPRLKLAKDLLTEDGVLCISMADNELYNLLKLCEEVYGKNNIEIVVWKKKGGAGNTEKVIGVLTEYVVLCFKNKMAGVLNYREIVREYKFSDEKGGYNLEGIEKTNLGGYERKTMQFPIVDPNTGTAFYPSKNMRWTIGEETAKKLIAQGKLFFDYSTMKVKKIKREEDYSLSENVYLNLLTEEGSLSTAKDELNELLTNRELFDTPKPTKLITTLLRMCSKQDSLVLDFFSGSATTAQAVMELNKEDGGNRKFIMVQLPEKCDGTSEAYRTGYRNICEIGKERIRRAGIHIIFPGYKFENHQTGKSAIDIYEEYKTKDLMIELGLITLDRFDFGFRTLKLDSSNMQDVYYNPAKMPQSLLDMTVDNIKLDRTSLDLLFQVMLSLGIELSAKIEEKQIASKTYYVVNENEVVACFDEDINNDVITAIAKMQPIYAVFKDKSFASDSVGINNEQLFKTYSPSTIVKVL